MGSERPLGTAEAWRPERVDLGGWTVTALSDGFMRLDGGAMWGVVPAAIWRPLTPPAEDNTIRLALRPFLLEGKDAEGRGARVVVEPGIGDRWGEKQRRIFHLDRRPAIEETLARVGVPPADVTHVVATHCHWDHVGAQVVEREGALRPRFPNARHFAPRIEVETASDPGHLRRASYRAEDVEPIRAAGLLETFEGRQELLPGLVVHELGGHSDGVSVVTIAGANDTAIFWGDVVPTTHHVQPPYIMAYDLDPARSFDVRSEWIRRASERSWIGLFYHDEEHGFARLRREARRYRAEPLGAAELGVA